MISRIAKIKSDFFKYAAYRIYDMKSRLIILCICGILGFPSVTLALSLQMQDQASRRLDSTLPYNAGLEMFVVVCIFLAALSAVVLALITYTSGINCYDYYNRRENTDKSWSLPVKSRNRFWGDFVSGILPVAMVYIISACAGLFIAAVGFPKAELANNPDLISMIASAMFAGLLTIFSVYIIAVFCAALCGRVYEAAVYPALIFCIIPALIALFGTMIFMNAWQINVFDQLNTILSGTSPGGFFIGFFTYLFSYNARNPETSLSSYLTFLNPAIIIPFILINAGFLTAAFYLGKKRGAEKTGQAFVVKYALEILISLVVFCITAVFCLGIAENELTLGIIFALVACTLVAFLILDVSAKRGFVKMGKAMLKYSVMLCGSVIVSVLLLMADGFGIGEYVPPLGRIKSVSIQADFLDSAVIKAHDYHYYYGGAPHSVAEYTEKEMIELVRQLNIESNNNPYNNTRSTLGSNFYVRTQQVTYTLNNGDTVRRLIRFNDALIEKMLPLVVSDDFKKANLYYIDGWLARNPNIRAEVRQVLTLSGDRLTVGGANTDAFKIFEAFRADYLAETFEQRFHSTGKVRGVIELNFTTSELAPNGRDYIVAGARDMTIHILPHYVNLIAELERQRLDVWNDDAFSFSQSPVFMITKFGYIGANGATTSHSERDRSYFCLPEFRDDRVDELAKALFDVAQPSHFIGGEGYMLTPMGVRMAYQTNYVIPPEYNKLAEELHEILREKSGESNYPIYGDYGIEYYDEYGIEYYDDYGYNEASAGVYVM